MLSQFQGLRQGIEKERTWIVRSRCVLNMALMFEAIKKQMAHDLDAYGYTPFIRIKERAVQGRHGFLFRRLDTQKKEETRDLLAVCRKILCNHLRFDFSHIPLAQNFMEGGDHDFGQLWMIVDRGGTPSVAECIICTK